MTLRRLTLFCLLAPLATRALQVTPNSPCAATCQDSDALDISDPNSSNTNDSDITCLDASYENTKAGIQWKDCMTCLQSSTFSQGSENDQMWFLYNARYAVAHCVFGFPDTAGRGSSPCITSTACGPLQSSLERGILKPGESSQYEYCSVNGSAMTSPDYDQCLSCISATGETQYTSNYLVALEAGCLQQPAPGKVVGLNDTVFSFNIIGAVDPSDVAADSSKSEAGSLPTTTIAVIVICVAIFIAVVAALIYVRRRKSRNRRARAAAERFRQWPQSPLSFQCQTHASANPPTFFQNGVEHPVDEMCHAHSPTETKSAAWTQNQIRPVTSFQNLSPIREKGAGQDAKLEPQQTKDDIPSSPRRQGHHPNVALHSLDTSALPLAPSFTYQSPSSAVVRCSPSDSFTTPTSTTSTRSTTQLLPRSSTAAPYGPADVGSPLSAGSAGAPSSPLLWRPMWSSPSPAPPAPPPKSPRMAIGGPGDGGDWLTKKARRGRRESGSPVETRRVDTVFPPPPTTTTRR